MNCGRSKGRGKTGREGKARSGSATGQRRVRAGNKAGSENGKRGKHGVRTIGSGRDLESAGVGGSRSVGEHGVEDSVVENLGSLWARTRKEEGVSAE